MSNSAKRIAEIEGRLKAASIVFQVGDDDFTVYAPGDMRFLLNLLKLGPTKGDSMTEKHMDAKTSRRIEACVTACNAAGISTEALEDGAVSEAVVLLEKFASVFRLGTEWVSLYPEDVYAAARAALAKLKGAPGE